MALRFSVAPRVAEIIGNQGKMQFDVAYKHHQQRKDNITVQHFLMEPIHGEASKQEEAMTMENPLDGAQCWGCCFCKLPLQFKFAEILWLGYSIMAA